MNETAIYITIALFLASAIRVSIPIMLGCLGESLTERVGNLNLGVEGMMLMGASTGFVVATITDSVVLSMLAAMLAAGFGAAIYGVLTITFRTNHTVTGLSLTIFGTGFANTLGKAYSGDKTPARIAEFFAIKPLAFNLSGVESLPVIGPVIKFIDVAFLQHNFFIYGTIVLAVILTVFMYKSRAGLHLRTIGENPYAADAAGIRVIMTKYIYVIFGGALCGLAGLYMPLVHIGNWVDNITGGRGWIVVALVIFVRWDPLKAIAGSVLFGALEVVKFYLDVVPQIKNSIFFSSYFLEMYPYIMTILVLIITYANKSAWTGPASLGNSYFREER